MAATTTTLKITGMHCASCVTLLTKALQKVPGVTSAVVNYNTEKATVTYDSAQAKEQDLLNAVKSKGYSAEVMQGNSSSREDFLKKKELNGLRFKVILSAIFATPALLVSMLFEPGTLPFQEYLLWLLATPIQFYSGWQFYKGTWTAMKNKSANMDSLIAIGTSAAYFYSVYAIIFNPEGHQYFEVAAILITLVLLGKYLEALAKRRTSEAISKLMRLGAKTATVIRNGKETDIPIEQVAVGDEVVVKPGQKIPVDGIIIEGSSAVDESLVTGESIPAEKKKGDTVIGSTINKHGHFIFKATKVGSETMLARIIKLIEDAQTRKAPIQRFADDISSVFVPIVIALSILTFLVWYWFGGADLEFAMLTSIAVLVIACPCALGLATPTAIMVGTGKGARHGILIKGGDTLEIAHKVKYIIFDKTGTITKGKPDVTDIILNPSIKGISEQKLLQLAASIEKKSEHPLADAVVERAAAASVKLLPVTSFKAIVGHGIEGNIEGKQYFIGSIRMMNNKKVNVNHVLQDIVRLEEAGKTTIIIAEKTRTKTKMLGIIGIADQIKEDSPAAIRALKMMGIAPYMITGDNKRTAAAIAAKVGIQQYFAEVLPEQKAEYVKQLQRKGKVAMVGDGINDAPAIAQANVGISMGSGTDVAMETGNIVLMRNSLMDIPRAIMLSRMTMSKIRQNMFWALIYNIVGIPIAAGVLYPFTNMLLSPMIAGGAMALSSVSVVTNALLLKRKRL